MSQAGVVSVTSSGPTIPDEFTTDYKADFSPNGTSIPSANTLHVPGGYTPVDNDNGIATQSDPDNGPNLLILLTNRVLGTGTSTNGSTVTLITVPLGAVPASYRFQVEIVGRETTTGDSVGYTFFGSAKTNGVTGSLIEEPYQDADKDDSLKDATVALIIVGNSGLLQVTGVAGTEIDYKAVGFYIKV